MQEAESEGFDLDINKSKKMPQVDRTENICFSDNILLCSYSYL